HLPAREVDDFGAELGVLLVERGAPELLSKRRRHRPPAYSLRRLAGTLRVFLTRNSPRSGPGEEHPEGPLANPTYSLRNPGTSMSSSDTRSLRMSVSSAET